MLEWMRQELYKAEANNENVYILTHIPLYVSRGTWAKVYTAIVDRFSYNIRG